MPIQVTCGQCNVRLRVPDRVAGKRIKCPNCNAVLSVPRLGPELTLWYVRTEDGETYGPVPKIEMDQWVRENRVTAGSQLLPEGEEQWRAATSVYPELAGGANNDDSKNPFAFIGDDASPAARIVRRAHQSNGSGIFRRSGGSDIHRRAGGSGIQRREGGSGIQRASGSGIQRRSGKKSVQYRGRGIEKSKLSAVLLCIFLGGLGVHRFYLGYTQIATLQLCTLGGLGVWAIIDLVQLLTGRLTHDAWGNALV